MDRIVEFARTLDPKVWKPAVLGIVVILLHGLFSGAVDTKELEAAVLVLVYAVIGYSFPNAGTLLRDIEKPLPDEDEDTRPPTDEELYDDELLEEPIDPGDEPAEDDDSV